MLAPQATIEARLHDHLRVEADAASDGRLQPRGARGGADGAVEQARAERAEEAPVHAAVRQQPHVPRVRVRQDRLRPVRRDRAAEAVRHRVERLVPGDPLEPARALRPHAAQRVQQAVRAVHAVQVLVDLRAQEALRERVVRIAADADRAAVLDVDRHHAGVRAVVRADDLQAAAARGGPSAGRFVAGLPFEHRLFDGSRPCGPGANRGSASAGRARPRPPAPPRPP